MNFGKLEAWYIHPSYHHDAKAMRRARLLLRACLLTSVFSLSYVVLSIVFSYPKGIIFTGFNVVGYFILPFMLRTKMSLTLVGNIYTSIGAVTVLVLTWFSGGLWSAIYPWIIAIPVLALLVVGKKSALYWSIFSFLWMDAFGILELRGMQLPVEYDVTLRTVWFVSIVPGLLLIIMVVSFTFENSMQTALSDVERQKVTIEKQSGELEKLIEDKDNMIRILAHDLRNPLANITMLSKLLDKQLADDAPREVLDMISNASSNAQVLVKHVLEMATLEYRDAGIRLLPTNIPIVVDEVMQSFKQTSENKGVTIHASHSDKYCMAMADVTYLRLVLENLVSNAVKYSPSGKKINISVETIPQKVRVMVRDYGVGIPVNEEDRLFKKFSRLSVTPTAGESSNGLGLFLVKRYMELMKGKVWFERPDNGSTFVIELSKVEKR
jgi:signal transduction histidine kinase